MNTQLFQKFYRWHRRLGYFLLAHLLLIFVTGLVLIFRDELSPEHTLPPAQRAQPMTLEEIRQDAQTRFPNDRVVGFVVDDENPDLVTVRMGKDGSAKFSGSARVRFDRKTGYLETPAVQPDSWLDFTLRLHREFLLGFWGELYVGVIGILFLLSLVSGLFVYGPTTRLSFGSIRRSIQTFTAWVDTHKFLGMVCFAWLALMGLSGVFLSFSGQLLKVYQYTVLQDLNERYPRTGIDHTTVSLEKAEAALAAAGVKGDVDFISFPGTEFSTEQHLIFVLNGLDTWTRHLSTLALVDADSYQLTELLEPPLYLKAVLLSEPLHFGNYGGIALKLIWLSFGCLGLALIFSGAWSALARKKGWRNPSASKASQASKSRSLTMPWALSILILSASVAALLTDGLWDRLLALVLLVPIVYAVQRIAAAWLKRSPT